MSTTTTTAPKKTKAAAPEDSPANAFATTLAALGKGNNLAELSSELNRLVRAVRDTGKKGKLVYTLNLDPVEGTDGAQVVASDAIKCVSPSPDRKSTLFFTTDDGELTRRDPNQTEFPFGDTAAGAAAQVEAAGRRDREARLTMEQLKAQSQ